MSDKCNDPDCTFPACNCWEGKFSDAVTDYDTKLGPYIHVNEHNRHQKVLKDKIAEIEQENQRLRDALQYFYDYGYDRNMCEKALEGTDND